MKKKYSQIHEKLIPLLYLIHINQFIKLICIKEYNCEKCVKSKRDIG